LKRICQACPTKYYDFDRRPILCPSCGVEFDPEAILKARRSHASAVRKERAAATATAESANEKQQGEEVAEGLDKDLNDETFKSDGNAGDDDSAPDVDDDLDEEGLEDDEDTASDDDDPIDDVDGKESGNENTNR